MKSAVFTTNSWESPLGFLRFVGPYDHAGIDLVPGRDPDVLAPDLITQADLVVIQRDFPRRRQVYDQILTQATAEGKPVVFELDDLLFELPDDHPDVISGYYGEVFVPMVAALARADAVTVTVPLLADYVRSINPNVYLLHNYLNDKVWSLKPVEPWKGDRPLVLGYMGGPSHLPDLEMIAPTLKKLLHRYGSRIMLRIIGTEPPSDLVSEPGVTWEPAPTYAYSDFAAIFTGKTIDLALAPLRDNPFNRCKSAVKFLEYSACGAAGVYSNLETYSHAVTSGKDGFLVDPEGWDEAVSRLVESPELRLSVASEAQETIRRDWLLSQQAHRWRDTYQEVISQGPRSDTEKHPLARAVERAQQWQDARLSTEGLQNAHIYELNETIQKIRSDAEAEILRLQMEADKLRMERDGADLWVKGILESRTWKLIQTGVRVIPAAVRPFRTVSAEVRKRIAENKWSEPIQPAKTAQVSSPARAEFTKTNQYDVIVFSIMDWSTRIQRPQQIALQFTVRGKRVFYTRTSFIPGGSPQVNEVAPGIWEVVLPLPGQVNLNKDILTEEMVQVLVKAFDELIRDFQITNAISLVDLPFWYPIARRLKHNLGWKIVYDCMDYHPGFMTSSEPVLQMEDRLVREADLVLATSHLLMENVSPHNPNCLLLPNGTDFDHFRFPPPAMPEELVTFKGPVIGYYGAIANWFDTRLIRYLALARPAWHFVLIGSTLFADLEPLQGVENVHLLGEKPYKVLPGYLHRFNAAVIPFKKMPLTDATNPVKLFEYLSAGKPVVAADLDELRHYSEYAVLASTMDEWLDALEQAIHEPQGEALNRRCDFARSNTWEQRMDLLQSALENLFPKVSIVVLTYNNKDYTRKCLDSIFEKTAYPNFEVVVVDNASVDGTQDLLCEYEKQHKNMHVVLNPENTGFARGNNIGALAASGDFIIFLNNDTVVTHGWVDGLLRHLQDPQTGMVGPVTSFSGNETRIDVDYLTLDEMDAFAEQYTRKHKGKSFEISVLAFMCVAVRRQVWEETGSLDEIFGVGMFEDDDYALRLKKKGYRLLCAQDVFIHHAGEASFSRLDRSFYRQLFEENRTKFEEKWGIEWQPHTYRDDQPEEGQV